MLIHNFLENATAQYRDKTAVVHEQDRTTYAQLNAKAENIAAYLVRNHVAKGDRVAICWKTRSIILQPIMAF